ncbi:hypothetical protein V8G54_029535, partial [Vigna mungo]
QQKHEIKVPCGYEKPISQEGRVSKEKEIKRGRDAPVLVVKRAVGGGIGRERSGIRKLRLLQEYGKVDMVLMREESLGKRTERMRKRSPFAKPSMDWTLRERIRICEHRERLGDCGTKIQERYYD